MSSKGYIHKKQPRFAESIQGEQWQFIPGYEGVYQVSNLGRVRNVKYRGKLLSISVKSNGYCRVTLSDSNKNKDFYIHRLVAEAFIPNPECKPEVNHIHGNKNDNRASQLEWSDRSNNNLHAYRVLGRISTFTGMVGKKNHKSKPVVSMNIKTGEKVEYGSGCLAAKAIGVSQSCVSDVLKGRQKTTKGYVIVFKEQEQATNQ